jgi:hypothetical protein
MIPRIQPGATPAWGERRAIAILGEIVIGGVLQWG